MRERVLATGLAVLGLLAIGGNAQAQIAGDFPEYKGSPARTGSNGAPLAAGSGDTVLRWYVAGSTTPIVNDNYPWGALSGPGSFTNSAIGSWTAPSITQEARNPYLIHDPTNAATIYRPAYLWTNTTPSASNGDPTEAATASDRRYFDWIFRPKSGTNDYTVSVWLPSGPTYTSGTTQIYPQQKFVYEVRLGGLPLLVDVVDSAQGGGWVRLGASAGTPFVIHTDGSQDITVRLYNTVPRDSNGSLILPANSSATGYAVYADAAEIVPSTKAGSYAAGPVASTFTRRDGTTTTTVLAVRNNISTGLVADTTAQVQQALITSYLFNGSATTNTNNINTPFWTYAPIATSGSTTAIDNTAATTTGVGFASSTATGHYNGADYEVASVLTPAAATDPAPTPTADVRYAPTLADGDYEVWAYLSGDVAPSLFAHFAQYEIYEGSVRTVVTVDQSLSGWVQIGNRRYTNTEAAPLSVRATNSSSSPTDVNKLVYTDAVRFIGAADLTVTSTPVQVTARIKKSDGTVAETPVDIVADERGVIHCLDAEGNGDGTTTEYWSYPSTPDRGDTNWVDPNVQEGIDGVFKASAPASEQVVTAIMPDGFNISSALVQRIDGEDYLFIAARNGRVYCIAMQGRGDYNKTQTGGSTILPGTTRRVWTYPNDPQDDAAHGVTNSSLGAFVGSIVYGTSGGQPTIFAPAAQGRLYALNAKGSTTLPRTTSVRWAYPAMNQPTLGAIVSTPSFDFGKLFVGTMRKDDASNGQLLAVNADDGTLAWSESSVTWTLRNDHSNPTTSTTTTDFSDFRCSPITVHGSTIGDTTDYVYVLNDNGYLYGLSAADGSVAGAPYTPWVTNTQIMTSRSTLGFTFLSATVNGTTGIAPVVTVSTTTGRFLGYLAKASQTTNNGLPVDTTQPPVTPTRYVISRSAKSGEALTPVAFADGWMYFGDNGGTFYAYSQSGGGGSSVDPNDPNVPDEETKGDEDPNNLRFVKARVRLITRDAYRRLQGVTGQSALTYSDVDSGAYDLNRQSPLAFDWGETMYLLVYRFPFPATGESIPNFSVNFSIDGQTTRAVPANTMQFTGAAKNYNDVPPTSLTLPENPLLDGYAVAQFTFQSAGQSALPPGPGTFQVTANNVPVSGTSTSAPIDLPATTTKQYNVANPLGLAVGTDSRQAIGTSLLPNDAQNIVNGSPNVGSAQTSLLTATTGMATDGGHATTGIYVYDRSLMTLLRPGQIGIDNVRVQIRDLAWQGGEAAVAKPLDGTLYPNFEDKPSNYPNTSKDYPDIPRDNIKVTKDPNGTAENPVGFNTSLFPPYVSSGGSKNPVTEDNYGDRVLAPTPFQFDLSIPKYQPANTVGQLTKVGAARSDSMGSSSFDQGYSARISVFVDSQQDGILNTAEAKEAYRAFNLYTSVAPSERLSVATPNVDLGSLAAGTGYSPLWPSSGGAFDPWTGAWNGSYKPFTVRNEGNVNLLNVRLAVRENVSSSGGAYSPFGFVSSTSDPLAWLDTSTDLYSDLDFPFAPVNPNYTGASGNPQQTAVILPKPRPDDRVGTELSVNPVRRANPNLGTSGLTSGGAVDALLTNTTLYPPGPARVGVSVPFGFPAGHYAQSLAVVENYNYDPRTSTGAYDNNDPAWTLYPAGPTPFTDPGLTVSFNVRETRLTTIPTPRTAAGMDNFADPASGQAFPYANVQPAAFRDARGSLYVAWVSNRPQLDPSPQIPTMPNTSNSWRIYLGGVGNGSSFTSTGFSTPNKSATPLRDLNYFSGDSTNNRWLHPLGATTGFPDSSIGTLQQLFGTNVVADTARFGAPTFPVSGIVNPYRSSSDPARMMSSTYLAFVGEAQTNTASGRGTVSRVFLTPVTPTANGNMTLGSPAAVPGDLATTKGKPSVVVTSDASGVATGAAVFYSAVGAGSSGLYYSVYKSSSRTFGPEVPLNAGTAFESLSAPSGAGRAYIGKNGQYYGNREIDLSFSGKLRNRPSSEVFMGRIRVDGTGAPLADDPFAYLPAQTMEPLTPINGTTLRARGVVWNREFPMQAIAMINGSPVNILMDGYDTSGYNPSATNPDTKTFDRVSGMITYTSRLGGKAYLDPNLGTVRFTSPPGTALWLTYQPKFVRLSNDVASTVASYTSPTTLYDQRYITDPTYWRTASNQQAPSGATITNDRYVLTYGRSATDRAQSRPLISTFRFGLKLPAEVYTSNGIVGGVSVSGATGPYQVDPANQAVYFTAVDEDAPVTITYSATDPSTKQPTTVIVTGSVGLVQEIAAYEVPIEQAFNEGGLTSFLDPFTYSAADMRRPPLIWMFWSSTRAGNPDVFFQTIAPQWNPVIASSK